MAERKRHPMALMVVLGLLIVGTVVYTVRASQEALEESQSGASLTRKRLTPDDADAYAAIDPRNQRRYDLPPPTACSADARAALAEGALEARNQNDRQAAVQLDTALAIDPDCVWAWRIRLEVAAHSGGHLQLLKTLVARADREPGSASAQANAARAFLQAGDATGARKYLNRASALDADLPLLHGAWGYFYANLADPLDIAKAIDEHQREATVSGDIGAQRSLAYLYFVLKDHRRQLVACEAYYAAEPDSPIGEIAHGCMHAALALGRDATQWQKRYFQGHGSAVSDACMHADLAHIYLDACRFDEAISAADEAVRQGCVVVGESQRLRAQLLGGQVAAAAAGPPSGQYWTTHTMYSHGLGLALAGRLAEAQRVLASKPPRIEHWTASNADWLRRLGLVIADGDPDELRSLVVCEPPDAARVEVWAGDGYTRHMQWETADEHYARALQLNPKSVHAWASRVFSLSSRGKVNEARAAGEEALSLGLTSAQLLGNLGFVYQEQGECARAVPLMEKSHHLNPIGQANSTNLARCLETLGRSAEAERYWRFTEGGKPAARWWLWLLVVVVPIAAYLGGKLALIRLLPKRFGHLRFP